MHLAKKIFLVLALILLTFTSAEAADGDLSFDPIMTTYTEGSNDALTLIRMKDNGSLFFVAADTTTNAFAFVPYSRKLYDFYMNKDEYGGYPPLIFAMMLTETERGQLDDNLGEWQDKVHIVPVYALFNVKDGQVICDDEFYSATSMESTHFHDKIKNPNHTRLVQIFITHMPRLHELLDAKGITLP